MRRRAILYFSLAAIAPITQAGDIPRDAWEWTQLFLVSLGQGLLALKALQSPPDDQDPPAPAGEPAVA